uniref:prostaglandin E receptor 4 (subtype EP4) c n=1 Tax=Pristiophorus japonicus TaxID=55135 RepID=UPI00398F4155
MLAVMTEFLNESSWEEVNDTSTNGSVSLNIKSSHVATSASMFAVGVVGNLIAIVVLCVSKKEQKETTFYTLVCGLAVTDLLGTCCTSPVVIATYLTQHWPGGQPLCHFFSFSMLFFGSAGMTILCAMSFERYLAINHAFFYSQYIDKGLARLALMGAYLLNLVFCILPFFGLGSNVRHFPGTWCFVDWRANSTVSASYTYMYGGFSAFLILVTVLCNLSVCATLISMRKRSMGRGDATAPGSSRGRRFPTLATSAAEMQMFWLLVFMTIVFLVCSIPLVIRIFVNQLYGPAQIQAGEKLDYRGDLLAIRFASFNPILDPWVYILCRKKLLTMGCERLKRTVSAARDGQARRVGWASGQQTPLSYTNSIATSYASVRAKDESKALHREACHRAGALTHSFADFTSQRAWEAAAHPFSIPQENHTGLAKIHSEAPSQTKASLCTIMQETTIPGVSAQNNAALIQERRTFDILNCTLNIFSINSRDMDVASKPISYCSFLIALEKVVKKVFSIAVSVGAPEEGRQSWKSSRIWRSGPQPSQGLMIARPPVGVQIWCPEDKAAEWTGSTEHKKAKEKAIWLLCLQKQVQLFREQVGRLKAELQESEEQSATRAIVGNRLVDELREERQERRTQEETSRNTGEYLQCRVIEAKLNEQAVQEENTRLTGWRGN